MAKIQIMTDSAGDISLADIRKYSIPILPFQITLGGKSYTTGVDLDNETFYNLMAQCDEIPTTSQITPFTFQEVYLREAQNGVTDLILVLINSKGSATYENSRQAIDLFFEDHPEYKGKMNITTLDGMGYNAMYGAPVVKACQMREEGATAEEIVAYLTDILPRRQIYFGIYTLKYAGKSGRIPSAAAFLGDKLNLKPIMKIFDRQIVTAAKCRGERQLIGKTAQMSVADMEPGTPYEVIYGNDPECREEMTRTMTELVGYGPIGAYQISAVIAANSGPKLAGVAFTRKKDA
jgi:DegV family protein with EDD domain